jgi:hypothetical protein
VFLHTAASYIAQVIKKPGESLADSFLEEGFVLDKVTSLPDELACCFWADAQCPSLCCITN